MTKIEFEFLSLSHSTDITFESQDTMDEFINDFLFLFVKEEDIDRQNHKINIQALQQNTSDLRSKVDEFIEKYKDLNVKVFQLRSYFQKLIDGEKFIIWNGTALTSEQRFQFYNYLSSLLDAVEYEKIQKQMDDIFGELRKTYSIHAFDENTKYFIGEPDKTKRVCRFCKNERENISYKKIAHAISEALGNKQIILNEECDKCNEEFGSAAGIESSLIAFLKFYTTFFGIKGKNGVPKIKGKNFIMNEGKIEIEEYLEDDSALEVSEEFKEKSFRLETFDNVVMQDIYRVLCKYALSVVDTSVIPNFDKTMNWINRKILLEKLPNIAILSSYNFFKTHPSLIVYIRQDNNNDLPYAVGEFHYTFLTFVFIIPLSNSDEKNFTDSKDYGLFWDYFKHYSGTKDWNYRDFSDATKQKFTVNLNLTKQQ